MDNIPSKTFFTETQCTYKLLSHRQRAMQHADANGLIDVINVEMKIKKR